MITPLWLSGSWRSFLYSSSVYSCHLFLISSASVRFIPFLSFIKPIFVWNVPLVSLIFLRRSLVSVVDATGDKSKVQCCKEQYCIGTWNVRSMNQGRLEVVKQEMARVNVDILGISTLKWTGMGESNSDDHYAYYCGEESLRRNGVATMVNKRVQNAVLGCNCKNYRMISVCFQGKPFNIMVIQAYTPTSNAGCWSWSWTVEWFYEDLRDLLELTPQKDVLFIIGDWNAKVGSQETPGVSGKVDLGVWNEAE